MIAWYSHHGWGWGWWPGIVWTILLGTALVAGAIYLAWRRPSQAATGPVPPGSGPVPPATGSAEAALAQRFARGDIDADEYRDRLAVLREDPDGRPAP